MHFLLQSADDKVDVFSLQHGVSFPLDLLLAGQAVVTAVTSVAGRQRSGDHLSRLLADLVLVQMEVVAEVAAELAVPEVQGLGLRDSGIGHELNAKSVGKLLLKSIPV